MTAVTTVAEIQPIERLPTGTRALDAVLGGGFVTGSATLLVGDASVDDKGTLAMQVAVDLACVRVTDAETKKRVRGLKILYATTRESVPNIRARARRVGSIARRLDIVEAPSMRTLDDHVIHMNPDVLIVDSLDRLDLSIEPVDPEVYGQYVVDLAHGRNIVCFCTTMDVRQCLAWEHAFDCLIDMRRDVRRGLRGGDLRVLSTHKNRFGDTRTTASVRATSRGFESVK